MRRWLDRLVTGLAVLSAAAAALLLAGVVAAILVRGLPALSWSFLVDDTLDAGASGGIPYQIVGTVILIATALAAAVPLALALALTQSVYLPSPAGRRRFRVALYVANGIPSIVWGIFGWALFGQLLGWGKSWLGGGLVLGLMILPTLTVAVAERMAAIPRRYLEAARGLGLSRSQTVRSVILPHSRGGLFSGSLLGLSRAAGETAPILFCAAVFSGVQLPSGIAESPVLALPYHIFVLAQDSIDPGAAVRLWGAAFVLLALVVSLSLAALPARLATPTESRHG